MICFLCKKNNFKLIYRLKTKNILCCKNDGLILGEATAYNKINIYGKEYFSNEPNKFNQSYFLKKLKTIQLLTSNFKPKILDVGCGWGDFEEVLEKPHFAKASSGKEKITYLGIDINKEAVKICQKKGLNCKLTTIQQLSNLTIKQSFSAITMFQLIEHNKNPIPLLLSAKKLLKKNGILLITTPNNDSPLRKILGSRWSVYNESSHFVFYNKKTLKQTLELAGFKNIQIKIDGTRFLSSNYIFKRLREIYFPNYRLPITDYRLLSIPIPTDPFGDLAALAYN